MTRYTNGKLTEIEGSESLTVVGDLHGDLESFERILKNWKDEKNNYIIFLGDYADRGRDGVEIIERLASLKDKENVVLLKGNHENYDESGDSLFSPCTLMSEVRSKRGDWSSYFSRTLSPFFKNLNLGAIAERSILFVHGGVSSRIETKEDLISGSVETDVLWSDPIENIGEYPNRRGAGVEFGSDVTERVLGNLGTKLIIRSHQPNLAANGPYLTHGNRVVTISSTDVYGGRPQYLEIPSLKIPEIVKNPVMIRDYTRFL